MADSGELKSPGVIPGALQEGPFEASEFEGKAVKRPKTFPAPLENLTGKEFKVRSLDYSSKKLKEVSGEALYELVGADCFKTDKKLTGLGKYVTLPFKSKAEMEAKETKHPGLPVLLVFNFMVPSFEPSLFGKAKLDGPGYSVAFYYRIKDSTVKLFEKPDELPKSVRFLQAFCKSVQGGGDKLRGRLKCIPIVNNAKQLDFGMATNKLLSTYNGKPFLTGPKFHTFCGSKTWLECDLDIYKYGYTARKVLYESWAKFDAMDVSCAFTIEGFNNNELPERIIGAGRFSQCRLRKEAKPLKDFYPNGPIWPATDSEGGSDPTQEVTESMEKVTVSGGST